MNRVLPTVVVVAVVSLVVACESSEKRKPLAAGPPAVASCDYTSERGGRNHSCLEIFDPSSVDAHEAWCNGLSGPKDHPTFARGKGCPADGRNGGCLYPNGTINWRYVGEAACVIGQQFKDAPTIEKATPYRCANERLCTEVMSVFDLTKTVEKSNCENIPEAHNKFEMGSCSADNVSARCAVRDRSRDTMWVFYRPFAVDEVKQNCDAMKGTFTTP